MSLARVWGNLHSSLVIGMVKAGAENFDNLPSSTRSGLTTITNDSYQRNGFERTGKPMVCQSKPEAAFHLPRLVTRHHASVQRLEPDMHTPDF